MTSDLTFKELLWQYAKDLELNPDADLGTVTFGEPDKLPALNRLNKSMRWIWQEALTLCTLPDTLVGVQVDAITDHTIPKADAGHSDWVSFWTSDPRDATTGDAAQPVKCTRVSAGWLLPEAVTEVFMLYRPLPPVWTTRAVVPATAYAVDALVWDEDGTGHVYRALVADALGSELSDAAKWQPVTCPQPWMTALLAYARYLHLIDKALPQNANPQRAMAQDWIDGEIAGCAQASTGRLWRWLLKPKPFATH